MKPRSRELKGWTLSEQITIDRHAINTKNVIGVIEGSGPHAEETVVIGGHYDHLGRGGLLSGSMAILSSDIHNGADDNASGTSMVLEMARRLGARRDPPRAASSSWRSRARNAGCSAPSIMFSTRSFRSNPPS